MEIKEIAKMYPFLIPRNRYGEIPKDYDYSYIMALEIPEGWTKLFYQLCADLRVALIKYNMLDKYYFVQIKEKYNQLRCYGATGAPDEIHDILSKYEQMAQYVCVQCGKPANWETQGYISSYCDDCYANANINDTAYTLHFQSRYQVSGFKNGAHYKLTISFENEWNRYLKEIT